MKLRTSFFNPTVFKKDLTRFAPTWVLYTVGLFMILAVCMDSAYQYRQAQSLADALSFMAAINLGYGLLNGQLLFGDLFNARHCNALHAIPLRRECWFVTHTVSGLLFSLVPNFLVTLVAAVILESGWVVAFWWLLAVTLQYLFFFSLAVLSSLCVGNRFAMVLVYGIINFLALIVYWFYDSIYEPLLYGVYCDQEVFTRFCPIWTIVEQAQDLLVINGDVDSWYIQTVQVGEGWGYLGICAAIGVAMLGLSLLLYRRRKLESAGDFMAVRPLEPVFLGLYTISMAAFFQMFANLFNQPEYFFLGLGVIIGFFTGRMLLMRTIRVFQPKAILACVLAGLVFAGSMVLTLIDPLGVTRYIPDSDQVAGVYVSPSRHDYRYSNTVRFDDLRDVEQARTIHRSILDGKSAAGPDGDSLSICLTYELRNGRTVQRYYTGVGAVSQAAEQAGYFFNRTEYILNADPEKIMQGLVRMSYTAYDSGHYSELSEQMGHDLMQAIIADCEDGNMSQHWAYRHDYAESIGYVEFQWIDAEGREVWTGIDIFGNAVNSAAYIREIVIPWIEEKNF